MALVIVDLQILLALGAGSDLWTFATLVLSVQPVVMFTLLQIRAFHASCIQCVIILLALATGATLLSVEELCVLDVCMLAALESWLTLSLR